MLGDSIFELESILELFGEEGSCSRIGDAFLLFPLLLFSGSVSGGALRGGELAGGVVLLERSFLWIGF